jgi:hypothetical protein
MTISRVDMPSEERVYTYKRIALVGKSTVVGVDDEVNVQLICLFL